MNELLHSRAAAGSVECFGQTFPSDHARREHFTKLLAEKLKDPAFRKTEGFPVGTDEAILAMSDPPYYTACPNPWLADFVKHYGKPYDPSVKYSREPLAIDVSVGKTDAIYKAHSYHTKVPHLAIVPSILHYTEPGDIVLDGFGGSGMTGVAAQWCGAAPATYRHELELSWKKEGRTAPKWGSRHVVLNDLSPAATFIGANYNTPFDVAAFAEAAKHLFDGLEQEIGWMYETLHTDGNTVGRIEYTVWSEVFGCPECTGEVIFTEEALDQDSRQVKATFPCPNCGAELTKKRLEKRNDAYFDDALGCQSTRTKRVPVLIRYTANGKEYDKRPDSKDLETIERISTMPLPTSVPIDRMMHVPEEQKKWGDKWRAGTASFTHVHHLFMPRPAQAVGRLWSGAQAHADPRTRKALEFLVEQAFWTSSVLNRFQPQGFKQVNKYLPGVYYSPSQHCEVSPWYAIGARAARLAKVFGLFRTSLNDAIICTGSASDLGLLNESVDYIFTDPPFGDNLAYSELNFFVEAFHQVFTQQSSEAVKSQIQNKGLLEYQRLMRSCFTEYFRVLKPGRWMTVVFSNTSAAVWNGIQAALQEAGFVIANVSALSKIQGSFNAVTNTTSVKQDLVISTYKPNGGLEQRFLERGAIADSVWDFVQTHLRQLPVAKLKHGELEYITERDPRILFDRMVAWFIRHNAPVPLSSQEFQQGLRSRFPERDGMVFLTEQVAEYDKKRAQVEQAPQMELFVSDERSAIDWLADFLRNRPSTYQEVHPEFITQLGAGWKKHESKPELLALLEDNFIRYDGAGEVPSQIHAYLSTNHKDLRSLDKSSPALVAKAKDRWYTPDPNKAFDLEKKREKALLKEFDTYLAATGRKLKEVRLEVLRAGFKAAWTKKDYQTIIKIAQKIPEVALQEDEKLLLWYDQALTRTEADA